MASGSRAGVVGFTVGNCSSFDLVNTSVYLSICPSEGSSDFLFLLCSRPVQDIKCLYLQYIKMPIPINIATASNIKPYAQFGMSISGSIGLNICNCSIKELYLKYKRLPLRIQCLNFPLIIKLADYSRLQSQEFNLSS